MRPFERVHRREARSVAALLGLLLEDVVQPVQQHRAELHLVPDAQRAQDRRVGHRGQRAERDEARRRVSSPAMTWLRADPEERRRREHADRSGARCRSDMTMKLPRNILRETLRNSFSIASRKTAFGRGRLDRFDSLDRVDLVRAVFPWLSSTLREERAQHLHGEIHEPDIERRGGEEDDRERRAVNRSSQRRADQLHEREQARRSRAGRRTGAPAARHRAGAGCRPCGGW